MASGWSGEDEVFPSKKRDRENRNDERIDRKTAKKAYKKSEGIRYKNLVLKEKAEKKKIKLLLKDNDIEKTEHYKLLLRMRYAFLKKRVKHYTKVCNSYGHYYLGVDGGDVENASIKTYMFNEREIKEFLKT